MEQMLAKMEQNRMPAMGQSSNAQAGAVVYRSDTLVPLPRPATETPPPAQSPPSAPQRPRRPVSGARPQPRDPEQDFGMEDTLEAMYGRDAGFDPQIMMIDDPIVVVLAGVEPTMAIPTTAGTETAVTDAPGTGGTVSG